MKKVIHFKNLAVVVIVGIVALASCSKNDNPLTSNDTQNVNSESVSDSYTTETADMANSIISTITSTQYSNGRVASGITLTGAFIVLDSRLSGAIVTINTTGTAGSPSGTITIDFGVGVTTNGVTRVGQIIINYLGKKTASGSTRIITYSGYSINGVSFDPNMTYTITNISDSTAGAIAFRHVLNDGAAGTPATLTFSTDNTTITRSSDFNVLYNYTARTLTLSPNTVDSTAASGTTRTGRSYTTKITKSLIYKLSCIASKVYIPIEGEKKITIGGTTYKIDYGDNLICDNSVTISLGSKSETITVNGDGN
jgi:hypothetical protein